MPPGPNRTARITPTLSSGNLQRNHGENKNSKHTRRTTRSPPVGPTPPLPSLLHSTRLDSTTHPLLSTNSQLHQANQNPKSPTPNSEFPPKSLAPRRRSPHRPPIQPRGDAIREGILVPGGGAGGGSFGFSFGGWGRG